MVKPFDVTRFQKNVSKSLGIYAGFHDTKIWVDSGNYALNMMISGDFFKGIPLGKVTCFAGESGSGKSYVVSGNIVKSCIAANILPVILDSEFAVEKTWLKNLDVDWTKVVRFEVHLVDQCAGIITEFINEYLETPAEERQPVMFIIDSLGNLSTPNETKQFANAEMKGDMGLKAKQLKALVTQCLALFGPLNVGLTATNHTYKSQNQFDPDDVISGGGGFIYNSSIIVALDRLKLKVDESGEKTKTVQGIRSKMKCVKSRFAKPFEEIEVQIPYATGMSPYSGLFDMFLSKGILVKDGNRYYKAKDKNLKLFKKEWEAQTEHYDKIMHEWTDDDISVGVDEVEEVNLEAIG